LLGTCKTPARKDLAIREGEGRRREREEEEKKGKKKPPLLLILDSPLNLAKLLTLKLYEDETPITYHETFSCRDINKIENV
jgi:hypothetical protein